ncbi:MAG TPA: hypothetical protein DER02_06300 [Gammaproteobacteria bacterium]|nr:hypothetical protein [Gammaproteobacteria bacterium]|tara:strand:+ start:4446 stop:4847 length:402 start_codon:yes stop_codon:yes gene_type:complete
MRSFRKYPNRRIYDLETSKYVNLEALAKIILTGTSINVKKADTEEDITQSILLQILAEKEKDEASPLLTNLALEQLIRFASNPYTRVASQFIEQSLDFLAKQKAFFSQTSKGANSVSPFTVFQESMQFWTRKK